MTTSDILDFETLLAPISDERPAGVELKMDPAALRRLREIRTARDDARAAERLLSQPTDGESPAPKDSVDPRKKVVAHWKTVDELGRATIATVSKDLWIAAWLIEALVRRHGFAGLRDGFRLVRELSERYWDGIHPEPDEDGYATTVIMLANLNGADSEGVLKVAIEGVPLLTSRSGDPLTGADFHYAYENNDKGVDATRRDQLRTTFEQGATACRGEELVELKSDVDAALDEFEKMVAVLDEKCHGPGELGPSAPPSSQIRSQLRASSDRLKQLLERNGHAPADSSAGDARPSTDRDAPTTAAKGTSERPPFAVAGEIASREDAFRALLRISEFFRKTEPHSPVSYKLEQAVQWGRMTLPQLIREMVSDEAMRTDISKRTGIPLPAEEAPE